MMSIPRARAAITIPITLIFLLLLPHFSFPNFPTQPINNQTILTTGIISSIPEKNNKSLQFIFIPDQNPTQKIFLHWFRPPPVKLFIGDQWMFKIKLKPTQQNWLVLQDIYLTGSVIFDYKNQIILPHKKYYIWQNFREKIYTHIKQTLINKPSLGFICALTVGMRDNITQNQWEDLRGTGTNHLMAIAGLHIGFIFGFLYFVFNKLWRVSEKLMLWIPAQEAGIILAFIGALFYGALSGFALPAKRAIIMLAVFVISQLARRKINIFIGYFLAVFIILILDLLSIFTPTFWLSFTAVGLLIYSNGGRVGQPGLLWHCTRAQWVMALGLIPLDILFFQQISWVGFLANIIAIPYIGFIILPLCLLGILFNPFWILAEYLLSQFWKIMHLLANLPHSQYYLIINPTYLILKIILSFIGILILLAPKGFPARWLGIFWLLPLFFGN